ncbi:ATP-binding cassette domain-containing protein [candidate division WWE3 bacterium]|nr:ATP-binding cassette domain-containing protein [candidate division WWE3 bacterium]
METVIKVDNLTKNFRVRDKEPGFKGSLKGLFKREYKNIEAVKNVSFEIGRGELIGFIGPNGAGKTTTLKMLSGLLYPTEGTVEVLGYRPQDRSHDFLKSISLIMGQKNQLWWDLPAIEAFNLNREIYEIEEKSYKRILGELIDLLDVSDAVQHQVRRLSLGQRMKCELIASLLHTPDVLFLDEPTIGLDVVMQKKIREFILEYNKRHNATIILTSHYMDDVKEICDRVIMINEGSKVYDGDLDSMIKEYADYKILIPIFNDRVSRKELSKYGDVVSYDHPKAVINVSRRDASKIASEILNNYDIDDLDINEPRLEDIIRDAFENGIKTVV